MSRLKTIFITATLAYHLTQSLTIVAVADAVELPQVGVREDDVYGGPAGAAADAEAGHEAGDTGGREHQSQEAAGGHHDHKSLTFTCSSPCAAKSVCIGCS